MGSPGGPGGKGYGLDLRVNRENIKAKIAKVAIATAE
jgi:hypothetical protein